MPQFDVFRTRSTATYPLVVDVQADLHARLATRLVVPLVTRSRYTQPATRLTPVLKVGKDDYVVVFPLMAAVPRTSLGEIVGSLAAQRAALLAALDLLITGS
jgi:toxin CcdB